MYKYFGRLQCLGNKDALWILWGCYSKGTFFIVGVPPVDVDGLVIVESRQMRLCFAPWSVGRELSLCPFLPGRIFMIRPVRAERF